MTSITSAQTGFATRASSLRLDAIVILNHLCYASGHGEMYMARPTRATALRRVDNFANGFLDIGARTVFALAFQPAESIVEQLFADGSRTMEQLFRRRGYSGWNGWRPSRHQSRRTPGAQILLDPSRYHSFRRAITGDLQMTVGQWRRGPGAITEPSSLGTQGTDLGRSEGWSTTPSTIRSPVEPWQIVSMEDSLRATR